jgi:hypothetical protein
LLFTEWEDREKTQLRKQLVLMAVTLSQEIKKLVCHSVCLALLPTGFQSVQSTFFVALFIRHQGDEVSFLPAATMFKYRCNQNELVSTPRKGFLA